MKSPRAEPMRDVVRGQAAQAPDAPPAPHLRHAEGRPRPEMSDARHGLDRADPCTTKRGGAA